MSHWWQWLLLCKPEGLGSFLLFLTIFLHWKFPYKKAFIIFSLLTGLMAFFTKSYFVCGFGSIVLSYLFVHRDKKMALLYFIYSSVSLISSILIINFVTNGLYYLFTFEMQSAILSYSIIFLFENNFKPLIFSHLPVFFLIIYNIFRGSFDYNRYGVFFIQLIIGLPFISILLLNIGGAAYYWYVIIPVLIVIGCDLLFLESRRFNHNIIIPVLLAFISILIFKTIYKDTLKSEFIIPSVELSSKWDILQELVNNTDGHVMNSNQTAILNIHAGKDLFSEGAGYLTYKNYLENKHNYSFIDIKKEIALKNYALIINPEKGLKLHVMKYYNLHKTFIVPGQFGRWQLKINVFTPKH
jgi:hypothetical protein